MELQKPNKVIVIVTTEDNQSYKNLLESLDDSMKQKLKEKYIDIKLNKIDDNNNFYLYVLGDDGQFILQMNKFDKNDFGTIFEHIEKLKQKNNQSGGHLTYKEKYHKYKSKYVQMKNIITKFGY